MVNRSRGIRTERDRTRRRGPRLGDVARRPRSTPRAHGRDLDPGRSGIEVPRRPEVAGQPFDRRTPDPDRRRRERDPSRLPRQPRLGRVRDDRGGGRGNRSGAGTPRAAGPHPARHHAARARRVGGRREAPPDARDPRHPDPVPHRARGGPWTRFMATLSAASATSRSRSTRAELTATVTATLQRVRRGERDKMRHEWKRSIE